MVYVSDARSITDGSAYELAQRIKTDIPLVLISRVEDLVFNEKILELGGKKVVVIDFIENGWDDKSEETLVVGQNTPQFSHFIKSDGWSRLHEFFARNEPYLYFKRELLAKDRTDKLLPIEYPAIFSFPVQSKEDFDKRPFEVFFNWGLSNPSRPVLHGQIWSECDKYGYIVSDSFYNLNGFLQHENNPRKWVTVNTPHYVRHPVETVLGINGMAKISVSLFGAGKKCFRSAEAPLNSIMALPEDNLAWTFEWEHEKNCIRLPKEKEIYYLNSFSERGNLYEIYKAGVETANKYHVDNFVPYLENIINK